MQGAGARARMSERGWFVVGNLLPLLRGEAGNTSEGRFVAGGLLTQMRGESGAAIFMIREEGREEL